MTVANPKPDYLSYMSPDQLLNTPVELAPYLPAIHQLTNLLTEDPDVKLINVFGLEGTGKTAFAAALASFADWIYYSSVTEDEADRTFSVNTFKAITKFAKTPAGIIINNANGVANLKSTIKELATLNLCPTAIISHEPLRPTLFGQRYLTVFFSGTQPTVSFRIIPEKATDHGQ